MHLPRIADPEQLKNLRMALDEYCRAWEIQPGTQAFEDAARHIVAMFNRGAFDEPVDLGEA